MKTIVLHVALDVEDAREGARQDIARRLWTELKERKKRVSFNSVLKTTPIESVTDEMALAKMREWEESIDRDERTYASIVRTSYERHREGMDDNECYRHVMEKFPDFPSWLANSANHEGAAVHERFEDREERIVFGDLKRRSKGLITHEEFVRSRLRGIVSVGNHRTHGNNCFELHAADDTVVYKPWKERRIPLRYHKPKRGVAEELELVADAMQKCLIPVTFKLKRVSGKGLMLYITYDAASLHREICFKNLKASRVMGIDLNPEYLGISIIDYKEDGTFEVLYKEAVVMTRLTECSGDKKIHELYEIDHHIMALCEHYCVSLLTLEKLRFKAGAMSRDHDKNRLCHNKWYRSYTVSHLTTLCRLAGVRLLHVNPYLSSVKGNLEYGGPTTPDMVAAGIELARRGAEVARFGNYRLAFDKRKLMSKPNPWKEEEWAVIEGWKDVAGRIKEPNTRYRFPLIPDNAVL